MLKHSAAEAAEAAKTTAQSSEPKVLTIWPISISSVGSISEFSAKRGWDENLAHVVSPVSYLFARWDEGVLNLVFSVQFLIF